MTNIYLKVNFVDKEQVKLLGGRWDQKLKQWYIPAGLELSNFSKWLPNLIPTTDNLDLTLNKAQQQGITLSQLLQKIRQAIIDITPQLYWVRAEVSEVSLHKSTGHCYLELVETQNGRLLAKAKAMIVREDYSLLFEQFKQVTGGFLQPGMQVLILVKLNFSIQYGFSLYIKELDPSYTIGDLAAKLAKIRDALKQAGLYERNKQLKMPSDFTKIAVLSPNAAAGLGDFNREATILKQCKLCEFYYYTAQFQGVEAATDITQTLIKIFTDHKTVNFDAIVIIRGGGAAVDLAWLNDYQIAKLITESEVIVFAGIGHERDNTIIDEVAGCIFDTPSKVSSYIFNIIINNAKRAAKDAKAISDLIQSTYLNSYNFTLAQLNKILNTAQLLVLQSKQNVATKYTHIVTTSYNQANITNNLLTQYYNKIYEHNKLQIKQIQSKMLEYINNMQVIAPKIYLATRQELPIIWERLVTSITHHYQCTQEGLISAFIVFTEQANSQYYQQLEKVQALITSIINLAPQATLKRGYTLVREPLANKVISSKLQANNYRNLKLEFYDGMLKIINDEVI